MNGKQNKRKLRARKLFSALLAFALVLTLLPVGVASGVDEDASDALENQGVTLADGVSATLGDDGKTVIIGSANAEGDDNGADGADKAADGTAADNSGDDNSTTAVGDADADASADGTDSTATDGDTADADENNGADSSAGDEAGATDETSQPATGSKLPLLTRKSALRLGAGLLGATARPDDWIDYPVPYLELDGQMYEHQDTLKITRVTDNTLGKDGVATWYALTSDLATTHTFSERLTVKGDVTLILGDGVTLTAAKGIGVNEGNSLTIYGQSTTEDTMGVLTAGVSGNIVESNAGIGGTGEGNVGTIIINGGHVTARGGACSAGIGCGGKGSSGTVIINGGVVETTGGGAKLDSTGAEKGAGSGIGCGYGFTFSTCSLGTVIINGGKVTATGGGSRGAGIGGAYYNDAGVITINGGSVTATGIGACAGIGGGVGSSPVININGGDITASGAFAAGIGCSYRYYHSTITITGGNIKAYGGNGGAGIGDGPYSDTGVAGKIIISGGTVEATGSGTTAGGAISAGIGGDGTGSVTITGGYVYAGCTKAQADAGTVDTGKGGIKATDINLTWSAATMNTTEITAASYSSELNMDIANGHGYVFKDDPVRAPTKDTAAGRTIIPGVAPEYIEPVPYLDENGNEQIRAPRTYKTLAEWVYADADTANYTLTSTDAATDGWYVVHRNDQLNERLVCSGNIKLILMDGCTLDALKGVRVNSGNSLTIYAQSEDEATMGKLTVTNPGRGAAGIGSEAVQNASGRSGLITINGGYITSVGAPENDYYYAGAAIGGGNGCNGYVVINNGYVKATAPPHGAAIGNGYQGYNESENSGAVTITGGTVVATAGPNGAAIGGGNRGSIESITITGGTITATAGTNGAAIGGGGSNSYAAAAGGTITISGGTVTATSVNAAAIGGGNSANASRTDGDAGTITITGGTVTATSTSGNGIGAGGTATGGSVEISGASANVTAESKGARSGIAAASVTVSSGSVKAKSATGAGIGLNASTGTVTITEGTVEATGSGAGAGITGSAVNISGGVTTASSASGTGIAGGAVNLDWTGDTFHTMEVTAKSYSGTVTFVKDFVLKGTETVATTDNSGGKTIVPYPGEKVYYLDYEGGSFVQKSLNAGEFTAVTNSYLSSHSYTLKASETPGGNGWFVVTENTDVGNNRIICNGAVKLILTDGKKLRSWSQGIAVENSNALTVYAQSQSDATMGKLEACGRAYNTGITSCAGIGSSEWVKPGTITINGGYITANGTRSYRTAAIGGGGYGGSAGGVIIINGGHVIARAGAAAAIGGAYGVAPGTITITGGYVNAATTSNAAAIGGGGNNGGNTSYAGNAGTITITGGTVVASGTDGAGIGTGGGGNSKGGVGGTITITGGDITASSVYGAGIGGGSSNASGGYPNRITITGGNIKATSRSVAGIGPGKSKSYGTVAEGGELVLGWKDNSTASGLPRVDTSGFGKFSSITFQNGNTFVFEGDADYTDVTTDALNGYGAPCVVIPGSAESLPAGAVPYLAYVGGALPTRYCTEYTAINSANIGSHTTLTDGWYVVDGDVTTDTRMNVQGDVKLILKNSTELKANKGITVNKDNSLTVYAQTSYASDPTGATMGKLTATSTNSGPCIGGTPDTGVIVINGGYITATNTAGAWNGDGIGMALGSRTLQSITINDGNVTAKGGTGCAGIGVYSADSGVITINGGKVKATGGGHGAGIGGSHMSYAHEIVITGGTVEATGTMQSAGIGGGTNRTGGIITITGGTVTATGGPSGGAGIGGGGAYGGGGVAGTSGKITITGGTVTATGGSGASGIGHGSGTGTGTGDDIITVTGGTVTATGGSGGKDIKAEKIKFNGNTNTGYPKITAQNYEGFVTLLAPFVRSDDTGKALTSQDVLSFTDRPTIYPKDTSGQRVYYDEYGSSSYINQYAWIGPNGVGAAGSNKGTGTENAPPEGVVGDAVYDGAVTLEDNWYVVYPNIWRYVSGGWEYYKCYLLTLTQRVKIQGDVKLVLSEGTRLVAEKGFEVPAGSSLTIYRGAGWNDRWSGIKLIAIGTDGNAAIGGSNGGTFGNVTVNGGGIWLNTTNGTGLDTSVGGASAGIGTGNNGSGTPGSVTINSGTVVAYGGPNYGAGIGGSGNTGSGPITINACSAVNVKAYGGACAAGIGGGGAGINNADISSGPITITGGTIQASGGYGAGIGGGGTNGGLTGVNLNAGPITISGGTVTATSTNAAGIGAGVGTSAGQNGDIDTITISGGTVTATGANQVGVGATKDGATGTVAVTDGKLTANGKTGVGAGTLNVAGGALTATGSGNGVNVTALNITAGAVTATGAGTGAGLKGTTFTITGGTVEANGPTGITADTLNLNWQTNNAADGRPIITSDKNSIGTVTYVNAAHAFAKSTDAGTALAAADIKTLSPRTTILPKQAAYPYLDPTTPGNDVCTSYSTLTQPDLINAGYKLGTAGSTTWYVLLDTFSSDTRIECLGDVRLILANGQTLTANRGVHVPGGSSLTVYGQTENADTIGRLIAYVRDENAGIGRNSRETSGGASTVTINSGSVTTGAADSYGAGIGSGRDNTVNGIVNITVNGGIVDAHGAGMGAGIGGGASTPSGQITITGGNITAYGGNNNYAGAGIGGGGYANCYGKVKITGGTVNAVAYGGAAAIGSGTHVNNHNTAANGSNSVIEITGGTVTATSSNGAAIGAGAYGTGNSGKITIGTGTAADANIIVEARATGSGSGIGAAGGSGTPQVTIKGGRVTATSASGAGIKGSAAGSVTLTWENDTFDKTFITASSYSGKVDFAKSFVIQSTGEAFSSTAEIAGLTIIPAKNLAQTVEMTEGRKYTAFSGSEGAVTVPLNSAWTAKIDAKKLWDMVCNDDARNALTELRVSLDKALTDQTPMTLAVIGSGGVTELYYAVLAEGTTSMNLTNFYSMKTRGLAFSPKNTDQTYLLSADFRQYNGVAGKYDFTVTGGYKLWDSELNSGAGALSAMTTWGQICRNSYTLIDIGLLSATATAVKMERQPSGSALLTGQKVYLVGTIKGSGGVADPDLSVTEAKWGDIVGKWISGNIVAFELGNYGSLNSLVGASKNFTFDFTGKPAGTYTVDWTLCTGSVAQATPETWNIREDVVSNKVTSTLTLTPQDPPSLSITTTKTDRVMKGGTAIAFTVTANRPYQVRIEKYTAMRTFTKVSDVGTTYAANNTTVNVTAPADSGSYRVVFSMDGFNTGCSSNDNVYYSFVVDPND